VVVHAITDIPMWSLFTRSPTKAKVQLQGVSILELMSHARRYARRRFCADVASGSMLLGNKRLDIPWVAVINCAMGATNGCRETPLSALSRLERAKHEETDMDLLSLATALVPCPQ